MFILHYYCIRGDLFQRQKRIILRLREPRKENIFWFHSLTSLVVVLNKKKIYQMKGIFGRFRDFVLICIMKSLVENAKLGVLFVI